MPTPEDPRPDVRAVPPDAPPDVGGYHLYDIVPATAVIRKVP
jgi:hypothetical protein